jgi:hypothetical protein
MLKTFERTVLKKVFEVKTEEVTGEWEETVY